MSSKSTRIAVEARSVEEFNAWYERRRDGSSMSVASRQENRGGQWFGLGGLDWTLCASGVVVTLSTAERVVLPDLPVVLAVFPERRAVSSRQAVAA
jgi:hypothetical protein